MLVITHRLGTGMATAAQAQVICMLNFTLLVNQCDIAGNLQRATIRDEHFSGYFQQLGRTQVLLLLCTFRRWPFGGLIHVCDKRIAGLHPGFFGLLPNLECGSSG